MGLIFKAKQIRELGRKLKEVKKEMKGIEPGRKGLKARARKTRVLITKMRDVRGKMTDWEVGELARSADKEGKKLDKLIELAEARERVTRAKISVREAKENLRRPKVKLQPRKKVKITFRGVTWGGKKPAKLPKRKSPRVTPKTPRLRR